MQINSPIVPINVAWLSHMTRFITTVRILFTLPKPVKPVTDITKYAKNQDCHYTCQICKVVKAPGYGNFMIAHLLIIDNKEAEMQYPAAIP